MSDVKKDVKFSAIISLMKYDPQGVLQCVYSLDPERNNLETLINITVEFYITQVSTVFTNLLGCLLNYF